MDVPDERSARRLLLAQGGEVDDGEERVALNEEKHSDLLKTLEDEAARVHFEGLLEDAL